MTLKIEILKSGFYKDSEVAGNIASVNQMRSRFGNIINEACSAGNARIDPFILEGLFFIESKGNANASNGGTYGLGQIDPTTASNIPYWLQKSKLMTDSQRSKVYQLFGQKLGDCLLGLIYDNSPSYCSGAKKNGKGQMVGPDSTNLITREMLLSPTINIWLSAMFMDYLIDKYSTGGTLVTPPTTVRLDRVIVHYNAGQGNAKKVPTGLTPSDTTAWVGKNLSPITSDYILKFVGKNGMIDVLTR